MMIGIVLETLQQEHEQFSRDSGKGEAGEVHRIETRTREMEQRLIRMEAMLRQMTGPHGIGEKEQPAEPSSRPARETVTE